MSRKKPAPDVIRGGYQFYEKGHAQTKSESRMSIRRKVILLSRTGSVTAAVPILRRTRHPGRLAAVGGVRLRESDVAGRELSRLPQGGVAFGQLPGLRELSLRGRARNTAAARLAGARHHVLVAFPRHAFKLHRSNDLMAARNDVAADVLCLGCSAERGDGKKKTGCESGDLR